MGHGANFRCDSRQPNRRAQQVTDFVRSGCAKVICLTALSFQASEIEAAYCIGHIEECPMRFEVAYFNHRWLQTFFDPDQLTHEIRWRIIRLPRTRGVEKPHIDGRNLVIQEIFVRQKI